jgi:ribosomal protein S18 acetylase RimI-like enzyme
VSTSVTVRRAGAADSPALPRMRWAFRTEHRGGDGDARPLAEAERWMRDRLAREHWLAWVADAGGEIHGHVFLQLVEKIPIPHADNNSIGYVTNFYVSPAQRNRGVGRALLDALTAYAREHALDTLIVWPSERSVPLYRRMGFRPPAELMELDAPANAGR